MLLAADEPGPVEWIGAVADGPFLIVCDHAGRRIPRRLGALGLAETELARHIAWDIGAAAVTRLLAAKLGAPAILQTWSRLVIDCNRPPHVESSIASASERTEIPGNIGLGEADRTRRIAEIFTPYHDRIAAELDRRQAAGIPTALIAVHSFTPVYLGVARPWHAGLLYNRDDRLSRPLIALLQAEGFVVGDNEPYAVSDESDYTIPVHAERRGLPYAEIEIRQDLIGEPAGQVAWAERLARALIAAWAQVSL
jgi:predicted N-formylglutamate amidohydrolase